MCLPSNCRPVITVGIFIGLLQKMNVVQMFWKRFLLFAKIKPTVILFISFCDLGVLFNL